ncbi:hypothetical protein [Hyphomicrobium sp. 802]|uniref:hypothetical protein n=1 Tax=Hyphomicrobium sp. 802 TaxID=1112272 RepID=UPI00045E928D|nr:hypothetical protein [Hyphomicrobium sp. 802]
MAPRSYRALDPAKIVETLERLELRISSRFPGSGLSRVCDSLIDVAKQTSQRIEYVSRPNWVLRLLLIVMIGGALATLLYFTSQISSLKGTDELSEAVQGLDALFNLVVLLGGGAFFVSTLETRWKRARALSALHELRSIVHVIDMHQLTKDPSAMGAIRTEQSPARNLTPIELVRYLDYCSEMLSLTAKCSALYAERLSDSVIVDTVGDLERLTSELSNKIWQKITIIETLYGRDVPLPSIEQTSRNPGLS